LVQPDTFNKTGWHPAQKIISTVSNEHMTLNIHKKASLQYICCIAETLSPAQTIDIINGAEDEIRTGTC
jgi:hypothetical protein